MAITMTPPKPVTDEDLLEFSRRNPGLQFERNATGEIIVTPTGAKAGWQELELGRQLAQWTRQQGSGLAFGPSTGFKLPDGSVRSPDASWVRRDRWDALTDAQREGFAPLCPEAVFEIASPTDTLAELREKMQAYLANGARLAVLVIPHVRTMEVSRPGKRTSVLTDAHTVALDPELPGFVLELAPLFDVLTGR